MPDQQHLQRERDQAYWLAMLDALGRGASV